jgi:hypothetical protein
VPAVEPAFGVIISNWHDRDQSRYFCGNDKEPTLPTAIATYVVGGCRPEQPLFATPGGTGSRSWRPSTKALN